MIKRFKVRRKDASSGTVSKIRRAAFALVEGMEPRLLFSGTHQSEAIAPFDGPVWHGNSVDLVATPASQIGNLVQKVVTNSSSYGGGGTITVSTAVVGHVAPNAPTGTASVRLSDGTLTDAITDLQSNGFGTLWGVTRSWTNNPGYPDNGQVGNNWMISQEPELFLSTESLGGPVIVITSGASAQWFTSNGNTTSPTFTSESWSHNTLTYTGSSFVLTDGGGNQTTFYGVSGVPAVQEGAFKSYQGVSGQEITANYNSAGVLTSETRSQNVNGQLLTESFVYSYYSSGYNVGEISSIQLEESVNGGTPMVTEQALYDYYNGQYTQSGEAFGNLNDLRSVQIENGQGVLLSEDYYRYYVPSDATASGPVGMLQYEVIGPDFSNFQASSLAAGTTAFTAPNSALQPFADLYLQYGSQTTVIGNSALGTATYTFKQVTEEVVANSGSSTATGNTQQTYRFSYQTYSVFSPNSSPNNWYYKTTETFPDLSTELVYCNEYGEALLTATTANGSQTATYSYNHFDPNGQVLYSADAAAVVGYTVSGAALNVNLAAHSGLIDITNYYGDSVQMGLPVPFLNISAASSTAAGSATGYVADHQVELGSDGTPILLNATDYIARSAGAAAYAATVYLVANDIIYANGSGSSGKTTAYSYSNWNGFEPQQVAETFTPFTNAQNGVSTSSTLEFDVDGNEIYYQAPGSNSGVSQSYDIATGAELAPVDISLPDETAYSAPISSADNYLLVENQTLGINATNGVLANDFDPDPTKTLSAILLSEPSNGSLTLNPDGSFSYVPAANFTGTDSFQYLATDGNQHSDMTTVTLTVASTTAENIVVQQENTEITLDGLVSGTGSSVSFTQPSDGTVGYVSGSNNQIYYLPDSGFSGTDSFSYIASDGRGDVADETVSITILPDGDSNVSDSTPPGTKTFTINDSNFSVNPLNAFTPTASGNYHFSAVTSNTTTPTTWYDSHGQPGTITTTTTQTLDVTSSGSTDSVWEYEETLRATTVTNIVSSGFGTNESIATTDSYTFSAQGNSQTSAFSLTGTLTYADNGTGEWSDSPENDLSSWHAAGSYSGQFSNSSNLISNSVTGASTQNGSDSETSTSIFPHEDYAKGATVVGSLTKVDTSNDEYAYSPTTGQFTQVGSEHDSFVGSGTYSYPSDNGTITGVVGENDSDGAYTQQTTSYDYSGGNWSASGGTGSGSSSTDDGSSYSGDGSYIDSLETTNIQGFSNETGWDATSSNYSWSDELDTWGNWDTVSGTGTFEASSDDESSYIGNGAYNDDISDGSVTGVVSQSGNLTTTSGYSLVIDWNGNQWVNTSGTGSGFSSSTSNGTYSGTGGYSSSVDGGNISGTMQESGLSGASTESSWNYDLDSNGQWEVTAGYGSTNYHTSDQQSYSGSGAYSSSSDGSALSGNMTESGNSGSSQTVVVNSEWLDGSWVDSGSSSQGSSTSDQMSYSATGNYNASVDNGSVNGTINEKGDSGSSYSGSSNSTLGADGNWTITSGSGLGIGSSEDHSSYTGSGDYSTTYNDGSSTSDVEGSINVHGNNDSSASYITNSQWLNDAWVQTGTSQQNNSTEDHSSYAGSGSYSSNTDNATYTSSSEGTITESGNSSSSSNTSIEATLDGNGNWDTDSGNGGGQGSSDDYSSYAGEGSYYQQLPNGWASGPTDQSGDSMSSSSYVTSSEWDAGNWITSGSSSQHSSTSDASSYSGQGNYSDTLSIGITNGVVQQTGDASGNSQSSLSLTLDTSGNWDNVAGNSQSTTDSQAQSSFNGSGTYESIFNGGDVEGTINESGDDQSSSTYSSSGNWDADVSNWVYSGTGEEDASSTDNATYSGDGNYENATTSSSISGDIQQNGDEYSDSGNSVDLVFTSDGQWQTVDGSGSGYGGSDNSTSYLGNGNYVESVANGSVYGTIDESGDDNYSSFYTTNLSLSDGAWVTTGTGSEDDSTDYDSGYTGSGSYSRFSADGSSSSSVNGTVKQVGSHDGTSSSSLDISLDSGGNWITYSGSGTVTDTQSDDSSYTGSGTYSDLYFGSDASDYFNGTINENGDDNTSSSYSVSSGWGNGQLNPNSGNGIESTIEYTHSTYSGSGGYETIYNDGTSNDSTIDGTNSEKGNDDSSFNSTVNSEMTDGVWDDEGTGNGLASGAYSTSYQGSGSGSEAGPMGDIYGTAQESGTTISSYSNKASLSLDDFNGSWDPISGNENSTLNTNDTWSFSGNSSYRWDPINNVSINGTQTDSANHDTSTDSDSTATLDGSGNWIISGSGHDNDQGGSTVSYTGNGPYARAIVGATTVDGSIDESGSRISSWNDPMAISQGTNGSYTYSGTGTSSDSTTDNFKYSGSGSSSVPSQESYDGEVDNSEADSSYTESGNYTSMSNGNSSYTAGTDGNWHMASTTTSDSAENKGNYIFSYHATDNWSDPGDNASGNSTTLDAVNSQFDISDKHNETITSAGTTVGSGSGGGTASASASHFVSYHSDDNGNVDDGTYSEIESYNYTGNWTETMSAAGISGNLLETNIQTGSYSSADSEDPDEDSSSSYSVSLSAGPGFRDYYGGISFSQFAWAYDVDDDWYYSVGGTLSSVNAHMGYDVPPPPVSLANVGGGVGPQQSSNDEPSIVGAWLQGFGEGLVDGVENIGIGIFNTTKEITFQAIDTVNSTADLAGLPHYSGNLSQLGQASSRDDFSIVQNTAETGASLVTFGVYNEVKTGYQLYNGQITVDQASQQFGAAGFFQVGGSLMEMYGPSNEAGETGICGKAGECFVAGTKVLGAHGYRSIERINLGQKVLTAPQGKEFQAPSIEPDNYRAIKLQYVHEGREYELTYLRRADEVEGLGAGDTVRLRIAELEIDGRARVLATGPCPQIESGDGQVVTGVIRSLNLDVRAIKLAGMDEPIEATANHPIYSEDALNFVRTDCLSVGERLRTRSGSAVIESIGRKPGQWEVFNLEVGEVHQYYVSKYDVLVHNAGCGPGTELPSDADYLNENGMYEKSSSEIGLAQEHHIVTTYEGAGIDAEVSRGILLDAAIDLDDEPNLVDVPGHYGPHPAEYHSFVRQTLEEAIEDLPVGSDSYRDAVKSALAELKNMLTDPLNPVTRRISR